MFAGTPFAWCFTQFARQTKLFWTTRTRRHLEITWERSFYPSSLLELLVDTHNNDAFFNGNRRCSTGANGTVDWSVGMKKLRLDSFFMQTISKLPGSQRRRLVCFGYALATTLAAVFFPMQSGASEILPGSSLRLAGGLELQSSFDLAPRGEAGWARYYDLENCGIAIDLNTSYAHLRQDGELAIGQIGMEMGVSFEFLFGSIYLYPRLLGGGNLWMGDGGAGFLPLVGALLGARYQAHPRFGIFVEGGYKFSLLYNIPFHAFVVSAGILAF